MSGCSVFVNRSEKSDFYTDFAKTHRADLEPYQKATERSICSGVQKEADNKGQEVVTKMGKWKIRAGIDKGGAIWIQCRNYLQSYY